MACILGGYKVRKRHLLKGNGFTLVELMITITIIGVLVAVALPSYGHYVKDGRRADAQQYLMQQAGVLERNYTRLGRYPNANEITFEASDYYTYSYSPNGNTQYNLTAIPKGAQRGDKCGSLSINHRGVTNAAINTCWS